VNAKVVQYEKGDALLGKVRKFSSRPIRERADFKEHRIIKKNN
jgi:hypothetical protein